MNIHTATIPELLALKTQGAKWLRVAGYSFGDHDKGDLLSWHKNQISAQRASRGSSFQAILPLDVVLDAARYSQNIAKINTPGPEAA